eukprot:jgi/Bigna1/80604/fgenesh1_pg.72_\
MAMAKFLLPSLWRRQQQKGRRRRKKKKKKKKKTKRGKAGLWYVRIAIMLSELKHGNNMKRKNKKKRAPGFKMIIEEGEGDISSITPDGFCMAEDTIASRATATASATIDTNNNITESHDRHDDDDDAHKADIIKMKDKLLVTTKDGNENKADDDGDDDRFVKDENSNKAWENYLKVNNSVVVRSFHGQMSSTICCPGCGRLSVTYEPFLQLSLPIPELDDDGGTGGAYSLSPSPLSTFASFPSSSLSSSLSASTAAMRGGAIRGNRFLQLRVLAVAPGERAKELSLHLPKTGKVKTLVEEIAKRLGWKRPANAIVASIHRFRLKKVFGMNYPLRQLAASTVTTTPSNSSSSMTTTPRMSPSRKNEREEEEKDNIGIAVYLKPPDANNVTTCVEVLSLYKVNKPNPTDGSLVSLVSEVTRKSLRQAAWDAINPLLLLFKNKNKKNKIKMKANSCLEKMEDFQLFLASRKFVPFLEVAAAKELVNNNSNKPTTLDLSREYFSMMLIWNTSRGKFSPAAAVSSTCPSEEGGISPGYNKETSTPGDDRGRNHHNSKREGNSSTAIKRGRSPPPPPSQRRHIRATKQMRILRLPNVLIVHLSRFRLLARSGRKIDVMVKYPTKGLDLSQWMIREGKDSLMVIFDDVVSNRGRVHKYVPLL